VVLTSRTYQTTELASEIQTKVVALGHSGFTCSFDTNTFVLQFAFSSAFSLIANTDRMATLLGLNRGQTPSVGNVVTAPRCAELAPPLLYLASRVLGAAPFGVSSSQVTPAFCVPNTENPGSVIVHTSQNSTQQVLHYGVPPSSKKIGHVDLRIVDAYGQTLHTNMPWVVVLDIETV
jgi:hypothetical protein